MFQKGIPKTFILFLVASFFIWLLNTFSKEYNTSISCEIVFDNVPQNRILNSSIKYPIDLQVNASGFKILRSSIAQRPIRIDAKEIQSKGDGSHYILSKQISPNLQNQLISGIQLLSINQDSIFVDMGTLESKKIPLKQNVKLKFHKGYELLSALKLSPDSVIISGSPSDLKNIQELNLETIVLDDVKKDFEREVKIELPEGFDDLKINQTKVKILGKVDKFTEGKIKVPIKITNLPSGIDLTMLMDEVEITYVVALSNFSNVNSASFRVVCDYNLVQKGKVDQLIPKLVQKPAYLKSYKMDPARIDFLIRK